MSCSFLSAYRWLAAVSTASLLLLTLAGCDSSGIGKTYPVEGKILFDDQPVLDCTGTVALYPDAEKGNTTPFDVWANLKKDGNYTVYTKASGGGYKAGAPPGWYKVTVSVVPLGEGRLDPKNKRTLKPPKVNPMFWSTKTSKLEIEVVENPAPGAYDLRVGEAPP
jgi:hypothetical protein